MSEIHINEAGKTLMDRIVGVWPAIMRERRREKILYVLSMVMALRGK